MEYQYDDVKQNSKKIIQEYAEIGKPFYIFGYKFLLDTHRKMFFISKKKEIEILVASQEIFLFNNNLNKEDKPKNMYKNSTMTHLCDDEQGSLLSFCICGRVFFIKNKKLYLVGTPDGKGKMLINTQLN